MKVILQQDIRGTGKKGQMVEVAEGYARNFLFPRKLAIAATEGNVTVMKKQEKAKQDRLAKEIEESRAVAKRLEGITVVIAARAGANGRLFGSVTAKEISEALSKQHGIDIEKNRFVIPEPIKAFGTYEIKCKPGHEITAKFNLSVTELE